MFSALIIDADSSARSDIERALAPFGFEFEFSEDAGEGVSHARDNAPDMIFLRVELPSASGFSVCNKLRRSDETKYIPLVMYAAEVADDVFEQHRNLRTRADGYLRLPLSPDLLVQTVGQIIELPERQSGAIDDLEVDLEEVEMVLDDVVPAEPEVRRDTFPAASNSRHIAAESSGSLRLSGDEASGLSDETDAAFAALTLGGEDEDDDLADEPLPAPDPEPAAETVDETPDDESDVDLPDGLDLDADEFELPAGLDMDDAGDDVSEEGALEADSTAGDDLAADGDAAPVEVETVGSAPPRGRYPMPSEAEPEPQREPEPQPAASPAAAESSIELDMAEAMEIDGADETSDNVDLDAEPEPSASSSMPSGSISMRRENFNLKSQIVARDREILRLKDEVDTAKRGVLDAGNRARALEHEVGELQAKLLGAEETALTAQEQSEAAVADRRTLLKREEGLKVRLDVQQKKAQKLEKELRGLEQSITEANAKHEAALVAAQGDVATRAAENEKLRADYGEVLGKLANFGQETAKYSEQREALGGENRRLSDNVSQLETELAKVKRQAESDFIAAQEQADKELEEKLATQADENQAQLEFQERASQERQNRLREEWEGERSRRQTELGERNEEVASLRRERAELTEELSTARSEHTQALGDKDREAAAARLVLEERVGELESTVSDLRTELREKSELARKKSDAIERAQQALAVALKVLD